MTIAEAQALAAGASSLAEAIEHPRTQIKDHGADRRFIDPVRYAWEATRRDRLPTRLDPWRYAWEGRRVI